MRPYASGIDGKRDAAGDELCSEFSRLLQALCALGLVHDEDIGTADAIPAFGCDCLGHKLRCRCIFWVRACQAAEDFGTVRGLLDRTPEAGGTDDLYRLVGAGRDDGLPGSMGLQGQALRAIGLDEHDIGKLPERLHGKCRSGNLAA